jgi:type III secretion system FlhB-like substrate exporter
LRQSIRKYVIKESQLIDSIATAQMEKETTDKVIQIAKENAAEMEKETGVVTSLEEADLRDYLQEVVAEFRNTKMTNTRNGKEKES